MKVKLLKRVRQELRYKFDKEGNCHFMKKSDPSEIYTRPSVERMLQSFYNLQSGDPSMTWLDCNWTAIANNYAEKLLDRQWRRK